MTHKISKRASRPGMTSLPAILLAAAFTLTGGAVIGNHAEAHGVSRLVKAVPVDARPAATERIARDESRLHELRDERRALRRTMRDIMTAETYAPERLSAALETDRELADEQRAIIHAQIVDLFGEMEPEAREKAARRIGRHMGTGRHRKRH